MTDSDEEEYAMQIQIRQAIMAEVFGRYTDIISEQCLNDIRLIKNNEPTKANEFLLESSDADEFTDQAWKLLGRYIANNTHLVKIDLNDCGITDEKMTLLFRELVRNNSLKQLLISDNEFGIAGVQKMVPFLQNSPHLSSLLMGGISNINTDCFELVISVLDGKSIEVLSFSGCNIGDISALDRYNLPCLQKLILNENNIGREGCIAISRLLQKEGSTLTHLYLQYTGIDDEGAEILAAALKHNNKLGYLDLGGQNFIAERGYKALLKVLVDVSSIENTYNSNNTLSTCAIGYDFNNTSIRRLKVLINSACTENRRRNPDGIGRAKVIRYHLNSQTLKELCQLQGIEYSAGSIFADIEPALLPKILALIGNKPGQSELYKALIHTAPDLLSYIDRKALINKEMEMVEARGVALKDEYAAFIANHEREMANLNDKKANLSSRLALIDSGGMKRSAAGGGKDSVVVDNGMKKRQRS